MSGTRELFEHLRKYPDLHLPDRNYASVVAFVLGYDAACEGGLLDGFREWLVVSSEGANSLTWQALLLQVAFPNEAEPMSAVRASVEANRRAVDLLFDALFDFLEAKRRPDGLREIFLSYQTWLRRQAWYNPNSPDWREP